MVAPIDYTTQVVDPFTEALKGMKYGSAIAGFKQAEQQREGAAAQKQRQDEIINALFANPNPTAEDYAKATLALPQMKDQLKQSWELHSEGQKKSSLAEISSVYSALQSERPEIAADILNKRADALEASGGPKDQIDVARNMAKLAETAPDYLRTQTGIHLASIPGGDKIIEGAAKLSETHRKEGLFPGEIDKQAADLNLTKAQTKKVLADVDKMGIDAKKAVLELEAGGKTIDPEKRFNQEEKLRKEYTNRASGFIESRRIFDNLNASATAGAPGDIALITSFMKMLDPGSVVRETEFATAADTGGLLTKLSNIATKLEKGEFLSESQRKSFVSLAKRYMDAAEKEEGGVRKDLEKVVDTYGLDAGNVFGTRAEQNAATPEEAPRVITVDY